MASYPAYFSPIPFYSPNKNEMQFFPNAKIYSPLDSYCENSTDDDNLSTNGSYTLADEIVPEIRQNDLQTIINNKRQKTVIDETKFKTEMCKNWQTKGFCNYEHKCKFAHGPHELNKKDFVNKNLYKSKPCNSFHTKHFCPYGVRCLFIHQEKSFKQIVQKNYYTKKLNSLNFSSEIKCSKRLKFFVENTKKNKKNAEKVEEKLKKSEIETEDFTCDKEIVDLVKDFL